MNLENTAIQLFRKIRGRFPNVTLGDKDGNVTTEPTDARFFEFSFDDNDLEIGKISISISEDDGVVIMYNDAITSKSMWFDFLKEIRMFSKKHMLTFSVRDIKKTNLDRRDYEYLSSQIKEPEMNESRLYGTSKISYQDHGNARIVIKHNEGVNQEVPASRTRNIDKIYIENDEGERIKYPYKNLSGARAMAQHVSEGGSMQDEFGSHITGLSEEIGKLRKFKSYMGRSGVMAESLGEYLGVVKERMQTIKKRLENIQKPTKYRGIIEDFSPDLVEDVPDDVAESWIDQLTIRQFNEELKDVFPYIYKLVGEAKRAKELGPDDLVSEETDEEEAMANNDRSENNTEKNKRRLKDLLKLKADSWGSADKETMMAIKKKEMALNKELEGSSVESDDEEGEKELTNEVQAPLSEFVLSYYDRNSGQFPKGETAVLTMVEKDYGNEYIDPAKKFIEQINATYEQYNQSNNSISELDRIRALSQY